MTFKNISPLIAFLILTLSAHPVFAQSDDHHESYALRLYYSDLYLALSHYQLEDVPFQKREIKVLPNDSLLEIAKRNRISGLDSFHLAAALYEANAQLFENGGLTQAADGSTIKMPSVGDIFYAQERYEKLKVAGNDLDFSSEENQMRNGLRRPYGNSLLLAESSVRDELPGNQVVTLASSRLDTSSKDANADGDSLTHSSIADEAVVKDKSPVAAAAAQSIGALQTKPVKVVTLPEIADEALLADSKKESVPELQADTAELTEAGSVTVSESLAEHDVIADATPQVDSDALSAGETEPAKILDVDTNAALTVQQKKTKEVVEVAAALPVVEPGIAIVGQKIDTPGNEYYLGPPKNSDATAFSDLSDPLGSVIEWNFNDAATVGMVVSKLAEYVGYEQISTEDTVLDTYTRRLPAMQRSISGITAEEGFTMLAGRGLETVFDHVTRSVKHTPRRKVLSTQLVESKEYSKTLEKFVQVSGVSSMLRQFPADIISAAKRHASRCDGLATTMQPDEARLYKVVIGRLQQRTDKAQARELVEWYESPTGRKVMKLEKQQIDDAGFQQFIMDSARAERIQQIYESTVTGKGISTIAVELDYAGWLLSGCRQKAENSGDAQKVNQEMLHGQGIKKKMTKLESILREDMLRSLAYQFSALNESELTEYVEILQQHAGVFSEAQKSIVDAIELETKVASAVSLD